MVKKEVAQLERTDKTCALLLGISHFAVDLACACLLMSLSGSISHSQLLACAIVYNGLAFAFQLPIGALGDTLGLHRGLAGAGCLLVALGALVPQPWLLCILIGLGNACFHVGGGREVLKRSKGKAAFVGRFVAPGAIGIFLGPKLGGIWHAILPAALLLLAGCLFFTRGRGGEAEGKTLQADKISCLRLVLGMVCMFLTVLLRSYMGTVLRYSFLGQLLWACAFTVCIFGGKYFGGSLADRFGSLRFSLVAQLAGTVLFVLSAWVPLLALPGIFLFNTTMAITATQLYRAMPQYPGTMFGLTTFALYLGVLPRLLEWSNVLFTWWGMGLLSLLSAALLLGGLKLLEGGPARGRNCAVTGAVPGTDAAS